MRILVAHASAHGSTAEIARRIADVLRDEGSSVDVGPMEQQDGLGDYDAVKYAESFGAHGYRVTHLDDFAAVLEQAMNDDGPSIIDVRVDYRNNRDELMADLESDVLL